MYWNVKLERELQNGTQIKVNKKYKSWNEKIEKSVEIVHKTRLFPLWELIKNTNVDKYKQKRREKVKYKNIRLSTSKANVYIFMDNIFAHIKWTII